MRLNTMQFDGDGGYDAPLNSGATAAAAPTATSYMSREDRDSGTNAADTAAYAARAAAAATSYMSREDRDSGTNAADTAAYAARAAAPAPAAAAKAKAPVDKSGYDRSIKVSQATVDAVKKDGQKVAPNKVAYGSPGYNGSTFSPNAPVSKEYKEATKRVYPNAKATPPNASGATNPNQPGPKAAAPKASAPKASAFPPILPTPSKPKTTPKPNSAAALPPLMTPQAPKASAPKADAKVKVSQATVDAVKSQGKATAIKNAKTNVTNAEYKEAVKRIYPTSKKK
jgi:carnitine O-acetyltransferase